MTDYTWIGNPTGDWADQANWYNVTAGMSDDGVPGAGDSANVDATTVTVDDVTVDNLNAQGTDIIGNITVTDVIENGVFSGGTVSTGTAVNIVFQGVSLTADQIDDGTLDAGKVTTNGYVFGSVDGATVSTQNIERDPQYASPVYVSVRSGSLTADTMTLVGPSASIDLSDFFFINGGTATITGAATAAGDGVAIESDGGTLRFSDELTLSDGADFYGLGGGKTTVQTLTAGEDGDDTIEVEDAGSTLTVVQTLTLGSDGDGVLTLASGGALIVDGAFDMAEDDGSTSTATIGDAGATLTIHGEWQIGVAGTADATITQGVTAEALGGITLGAQATGNGTLTVSQANTVLSITGDVVIGEAGAGAVNVQDGAVVDAAASDVTVGEESAATGAATVTGDGSQFQTGSLTIGSTSTKATVTVSSGGDLEMASDLTLGEEAGSKGALSVTDAGSQVSVGGDATLGEAGSGTLTMTAGAAAVAGAMTLGEDKGSSGKLIISDATVSITGDLKIGEAGSGTAIVQSASVLKSNAIELGGALGASGSLTISGAGTSVTTGETTIGAGGTGTLKINSGGLLTTSGDATIGSVALGAIVSASLDTGGQWVIGGSLDVGDSGAGTLSIAGKGTLVTADGDMTIGGAAGGTVTLGSTARASSAGLKWDNLFTVGEGAKERSRSTPAIR
jgi:T5SS/PEP-CTERM-associated repeat protein